MTLLERHRDAELSPSSAAPSRPPRWRGRAVAAGLGVVAATLGLVAICLPVLLGWVASPDSTVAWTQAAGVAAATWLLAHGAPLSFGGTTVTLVPILLTGLLGAITLLAARYVVARLPRGPGAPCGRLGVRRDVTDAFASFPAAYAGGALLLGLAAGAAGVNVPVVTEVLVAALWASGSMLTALLLGFRDDVSALAPLAVRRGRPLCGVVRRAWRPALAGVGAVMASGVVLVLVMVAMHAARVAAMSSRLDPGPGGLVVLIVAQLLLLPNLALWAASFMAGPGFSLGSGTGLTWAHANPGMLPMVPALGAVPDPGPLPAWTSALVFVPVLAGALVGWRTLRGVARLSSLVLKLRLAGSSCLCAAMALTVLAWWSGGSLGTGRLSYLGPPAVLLGGALLAEMALGAVVWVLGAHLLGPRRRPPASSTASSPSSSHPEQLEPT